MRRWEIVLAAVRWPPKAGAAGEEDPKSVLSVRIFIEPGRTMGYMMTWSESGYS
jgi:hypothetical protein